MKEAAEEQRGRLLEDVWHADVLRHAADEAAHQEALSAGKRDGQGRGTVTIGDVLRRLGVEAAKQDQSAANRVARCLKAGGWEKFRLRSGSVLEWRYRLVSEAPECS